MIKRIFFTVCVASTFLFAGCSGCNRQSELELKRAQDLAAVEEQRRQDSIKAAQRLQVERETRQRIADSLASLKPKLEKAIASKDVLAPEIEGKKIEREMPVDIEKIQESTSELEDELRPTIEAAKRRLDGVRGYVAFKLIISPIGRVKQIIWEHNDLDAQAQQAIQGTIYSHLYPRWDASKLAEYKTSSIKFSF